jgi:RND family efflux transporter MFP subunit
MHFPPVIRQLILAAIVLAVGTGVALFLLGGKSGPQPRSPQEQEIAELGVLLLEPATTAIDVRTQGTVQPRTQIELVAQVSGRVVEVAPQFAAGGFFKSGESLVAVEEADYRFALVRAEARIADAAQALATERARAGQARKEWRDLGNRDANDLFLRIPQLASAEAQLAAATAERDQARLDLQRTAISAPFDGRVLETAVDLGQYVNAGQRIARVYATDRVEVRLPLTDRQVALLELPLSYAGEGVEPAHVPVVLSGVFGRQSWEWQGEIARTDAAIDAESRVVYAVAEVADPFARAAGSDRPPLGIGQFVEARISGRAIGGVIRVPRMALQPEDRLWVVGADDRLQLLGVELLQAEEQSVALRLAQAGPLRVVYPVPPGLREGMQVRALPGSPEANRP